MDGKQPSEEPVKLLGTNARKGLIEGRACYYADVYPFTAHLEQTPIGWWWKLYDRSGNVDSGHERSRRRAISSMDDKATKLVKDMLSLTGLQTQAEES